MPEWLPSVRLQDHRSPHHLPLQWFGLTAAPAGDEAAREHGAVAALLLLVENELQRASVLPAGFAGEGAGGLTGPAPELVAVFPASLIQDELAFRFQLTGLIFPSITVAGHRQPPAHQIGSNLPSPPSSGR